jgi:hypothetical protein
MPFLQSQSKRFPQSDAVDVANFAKPQSKKPSHPIAVELYKSQKNNMAEILESCRVDCGRLLDCGGFTFLETGELG